MPEYTKPPSSLWWRHAAEVPVPAPEGDRALLVWDAEAEEVFKAEWTGGCVSPGQFTDDQCWHAPGAEIEHFTPGPLPSCYWWTWANGDPYTRSSLAARQKEKAEAYLKTYGASEEVIRQVVWGSPRADAELAAYGAKDVAATEAARAAFTGWRKGMEAIDTERGCGGIVVKVTSTHLTLAVESCESGSGDIDLVQTLLEDAAPPASVAEYGAPMGTVHDEAPQSTSELPPPVQGLASEAFRAAFQATARSLHSSPHAPAPLFAEVALGDSWGEVSVQDPFKAKTGRLLSKPNPQYWPPWQDEMAARMRGDVLPEGAEPLELKADFDALEARIAASRQAPQSSEITPEQARELRKSVEDETRWWWSNGDLQRADEDDNPLDMIVRLCRALENK